jgi:Ni/Fe-hydrogenase subunit HybB-like protein
MAQAKARDLWQSPALLPVLLCHALAAGAASHLIVAAIVGFPSEDLLSLFKLMLLATVVGMGITLLELFLPHVNQDLSRICGMILKGKFAKRFWMGSVLATTFLPLILLQWIYFMGVPDPFSFWSACASGLVLAGLLIHQDIWVRAGQSIPLS